MTLRVSRDGAVRVAAHGDLVRLDVTDLTVLVKNSERVALRLVDNADCLLTVNVVNLMVATGMKWVDSLKLYEVVELIVANSIGAGADFGCLAEVLREDGDLKSK